MEESDSTTGELVARRYVLLEEIKQGGMGKVWLAHDQKLGRNVALKMMRAKSLEAFPDARERFEREAKAAASLRSSHVVQVHDYGVHDDTPFISMELLEGESLKERLESDRRMSVVDTAILLRQIAKGLRAAHSADLVHRDLKPSNIFLAVRDDEEVVKLLDFGVVKTPVERRGDDTASGVLLGTPQYMAPEQARGLKNIDHRADLWSVAVILYTMLTGENPFESDAEAVGDIVIRVCVNPIPVASEVNPDLPKEFDAFFERALQRDPEDRFQSVDELVESFMIAGEMSFESLEERFADTGSGRASFRSLVEGATPAGVDSRSREDSVRRRRAAVEESAGGLTRQAMSDDSTMRRLARSLPKRRGARIAAAVGGVGALIIGGLAAHALFGPKPPTPATEPVLTASVPTEVVAPPASDPPPTSTTAPTAAPSAAPVASTTSRPVATTPAVPATIAVTTQSTAAPPPSAEPTATATVEPSAVPVDKPPNWYDEKKP